MKTTIKSIWISPHDDDQALFGAYTCMREKPLVVVVLDSYIQPNRGEVGCSAEERAEETRKSCEILGVEVKRLGLRDDNVTYQQILDALKPFRSEKLDEVYAPMYQRGNNHHDIINQACIEAFGERVTEYPTYTKTDLYTEATIEVKPTPDEELIKERALDSYQSQIRINKPHFDAVKGKSEWLMGKRRINIGSGARARKGYINLDNSDIADIQADYSKVIPLPNEQFDLVFSEDNVPENKETFFREVRRVLKPRGFVEMFLTDASKVDFHKDFAPFLVGFRPVFAGLLKTNQTTSLHFKYQKS